MECASDGYKKAPFCISIRRSYIMLWENARGVSLLDNNFIGVTPMRQAEDQNCVKIPMRSFSQIYNTGSDIVRVEMFHTDRDM